MIDHVSIPVKNLESAEAFYSIALSKIGYEVLKKAPGTIGYGKKYPEFWLNERPTLAHGTISDGFHVCLRTSSTESVVAFYQAAIENGGSSDGEPGYRMEYTHNYYAAFVQDSDGNKIEVVTFT